MDLTRVDDNTVKVEYTITLDELKAVKTQLETIIAREKDFIDKKYEDRLNQINAQIAEYTAIATTR